MGWLRKEVIIEPAAPAIIMAMGVFFIGVMDYVTFGHDQVEQYLVIALSLVTLYIYSLLIVVYHRKEQLLQLVRQPVRSFAIGTWVAAISMLSNVLLLYFPSTANLLRVMALCNVLLLCFFLRVFVHAFYQLYKKAQQVKVEGIVLLSTVSLQSVVISLTQLFENFPIYLAQVMILGGFIFYVLGLILIIYSYKNKKKSWNLADDWANTNCIIHGALSITGLALVMTDVFPVIFIHLVWWASFCLLVLIESIELVRAVKRVKKYGFRHGVFSYHVTQWSRNFTFGMFFAFTYTMLKNKHVLDGIVYSLQHAILNVWAWVVSLFLFIQIILFLYGKSLVFIKKESFYK